MFFRCKTEKIIQAAAVLLRLAADRRMSYLRLLKLLYIADRDNLRDALRPIIGTRPVAMKDGPTHSKVYDLVKGQHWDEALWSNHIRKDGYQVELVKDPGVSELSRFEIRVLTEVFEQRASKGDWEIVEETHGFPEWDKNYPDKSANTSRTIPFEDLIDALGRSAEKGSILEEAEEDAAIDNLFSRSS
jgi:uncharacterized phage-associated protein